MQNIIPLEQDSFYHIYNCGINGENLFRDDDNNNKIKPPHQYFSNLFNAYSKAINKRYSRHGSLFERPFKRKFINNEEYLQTVVVYIHNNPVHHGFVNRAADWPWSSYVSCMSSEPTKMKRNEVIEIFDDVDNFKYVHQQKIELIEIEKYLEL